MVVGVDERTDRYVGTEMGRTQVGGGPHGGCGSSRLVLGWRHGCGEGWLLEKQGSEIGSTVTTGTQQ